MSQRVESNATTEENCMRSGDGDVMVRLVTVWTRALRWRQAPGTTVRIPEAQANKEREKTTARSLRCGTRTQHTNQRATQKTQTERNLQRESNESQRLFSYGKNSILLNCLISTARSNLNPEYSISQPRTGHNRHNRILQISTRRDTKQNTTILVQSKSHNRTGDTAGGACRAIRRHTPSAPGAPHRSSLHSP